MLIEYTFTATNRVLDASLDLKNFAYPLSDVPTGQPRRDLIWQRIKDAGKRLSLQTGGETKPAVVVCDNGETGIILSWSRPGDLLCKLSEYRTSVVRIGNQSYVEVLGVAVLGPVIHHNGAYLSELEQQLQLWIDEDRLYQKTSLLLGLEDWHCFFEESLHEARCTIEGLKHHLRSSEAFVEQRVQVNVPFRHMLHSLPKAAGTEYQVSKCLLNLPSSQPCDRAVRSRPSHPRRKNSFYMYNPRLVLEIASPSEVESPSKAESEIST